jgi:hypothetical protein
MEKSGIINNPNDNYSDPTLKVNFNGESMFMKTITVGFSTTNKLSSKLLRFFTRSKFSHAWNSYFDETLEMKLVMQAELTGYELKPWKRWKRENILVSEYEMVNPSYSAIKEMATYIGSKYDVKSAFLSGAKEWLKKWFSLKCTINPRRSPRKMMCVESVVRFIKLSGIECNLNPDMTTYSELQDFISNSPEFIKVK